jgi:hypothetical protein
MVADLARDLADGAITLSRTSEQLMGQSAADERASAHAPPIMSRRVGENKFAKNGR